MFAERAFDGGKFLFQNFKIRSQGVADIVETVIAIACYGMSRLETCPAKFLRVVLGSLLRLLQRPFHGVYNPVFLATTDNLQLVVNGQPKKSGQFFSVIEDPVDICTPSVR